jgi:VCBS repeat-containing protein
VSITVNGVNDPPVAVQDSAATAEDTPVVIPVLANDTDPENDALSVTGVSAPSHGTAAVNPDGSVTYSPASNYNGSDSFTYTVSDGSGGSAAAAVNITVNGVNDPPVAGDDLLTVLEDGPMASVNVLNNDSDIDGDTLTVTGCTQPAHGSVMEDESPGVLTYTPTHSNYNGPDALSYTVSDGHGGTATATVNVTVTLVNDEPTARDDTATTSEDTPIIIIVLANDFDVDGDPLEVNSGLLPEQKAEHGSITFNPDNTITYTPDANFHGTDLFGYYAEDPSGARSIGLVTVTVTPINDPPVAYDGNAVTNEDTPVTVNVSSSDPDGPGRTFALVSSFGAQSVEVYDAATGVFVFNPQANFAGDAWFTFKVNDGLVDSNTATVFITVNPVNDPPVAEANGPYNIGVGEPLSLDGSGSQDPDAPADSIAAYEWDTSGENNFGPPSPSPIFTMSWEDLYLSRNGSILIGVPFAITLRVTDSNGATDTASTMVMALNSPPIANAGGPYEITIGEPLSLDASGSIDPDLPCDSIVRYEWDTNDDGIFESSTVNPVFVVSWEDYWAWRNGQIVIGQPMTLTLRVTDGHGAADTVSTTVTVLNSAPIADAGGPYEITTGGSLTLDASGSSDPDAQCGDTVTYAWDLDGDDEPEVETSDSICVITWEQLLIFHAGGMVVGETCPITLWVTDANGAATPAAASFTLLNSPPEAHAGGPYETTFGQGISLDGSASVDPDTGCGDSITRYDWDIGGDGVWDKVETSPAVFVTWPELTTILSPLLIGQAYPIILQVSDDSGEIATAITTVTVANTPPTAAFTFTPASPTTVDTVNFTDGSSDLEAPIASWSWNFGDGATSTSQNPSHLFAAPGTYTVILTVTDAHGATGIVSHDVAVSQAGNTQPGTNVSFTDPAAGVTITYSQVTSAGNTTITTSSTGPGKPDGFWFQDLFFEISTTAGYTAPVIIAIHYDDTLIPGGEQREAQLKLLHSDGSGGWTDVTTSVDTVNNIIYGEVSSFSWFAIGWAEYDWLGFLPPVEGATRPFKRGSTIPIKFHIAQAGQPVRDAVATLSVYYLVEGVSSGEAQVVSTAAGDWGDRFRYDADSDLYIFNLNTRDPSYLGYYTYLAEVVMDDGTTHTIQFSLK